MGTCPQVWQKIGRASCRETSMADVFTEQGNLSKLGIGLQADGTFKTGNIEGIMIYVASDGEIYAKISPSSKVYANEEIHSR